MISNGNFFTLFLVLNYMSFIEFLLAENSTKSTLINDEKTDFIDFDRNSFNKTQSSNNLNLDSEEQEQEQTQPHKIQLDTILTVENDYEELPVPEALFGSKTHHHNEQQKILFQKLSAIESQQQQQQQSSELPVFPERQDAVYFVVAVIGGAKTWGRLLARTLLEMGQPFVSPMGPPLRPLYINLPENGRFSANVLTSLCDQIGNIPLAGIIVIGDGQSARAIALSGNAMKIPVLWARGGTANIYGIQRETQNPLQSMLQPSSREIFKAVRALFLQTHWHSFFILSDVDATIILSGSEGRTLKEPPLNPKILPLPIKVDGDVFRQLAQISRSTRGIVLLLCNLMSARKVMTEAKRLNMDGGHFIWLWADTNSQTEFFDFNLLHHPKNNMEENFLEYPEAVKQQKFNSNNDNIETIYNVNGEKSDFSSETTTVFDNENISKHLNKNIGDEISVRSKRPQTQFVQRAENMKKEDSIKWYGSSNEVLDPFNNRIGNNKYGQYVVGLKSNPYETTKFKRSSIDPNSRNEDKISSNPDVYDSTSTEFESFEFDSNYGWYSINENDTEPDPPESSPVTSVKKQKLKRKSSFFHHKNQSHVLFHYFKDFPVGLLALRPIRMPVDRNFVRATIRLFASTWAKVESDEQNFEYFGGKKSIRNIDNLVHQIKSKENLNKTNIEINNKNPIYKSNIPINLKYNDRKRRRIRRFSNRKTHRRRKREDNSKINNFLNNNNNKNNDKNLKNLNIDKNETVNRKLMLLTNLVKNNNNKNNNNNINLSRKIISTNIFNMKKIDNFSSDSNLISSNNQNLSGLNSQHQKYLILKMNKTENNNYKKLNIINSKRIQSNINSNNFNVNKKNFIIGNLIKNKQKRHNSWWSNVDNVNRYNKIYQSQKLQQQILKKNTPSYVGGCFGIPGSVDIKRSETFAKALSDATELVLAGEKLASDGIFESSLVTNFELLNLVPDDSTQQQSSKQKNKDYLFEDELDIRRRGPRKHETKLTRWRRVGEISGTNVHLDTIVWPGGDIVVSGLSARSRTVFRIVTTLAPPFVMESERDEDGLCLRGLPCHRLSSIGKHNLTLMFNAIETTDRLKEDAMEHGEIPPEDEDIKNYNYNHNLYRTKCCYGLSMDLLDNIATELGFEFHLYIVRDELFGTKYFSLNDFIPPKESKYNNDDRKNRKPQWNVNSNNNNNNNNNNNAYVNKKDQYTNRIHHPPEGRSFHSASLNSNDKGNERGGSSVGLNQYNQDIIFENTRNNEPSDWINSNQEREGYFDENNVDDVNSDENSNEDFSENSKRQRSTGHWNGIIGDLISGSADMSFAPLTVSRSRSEVIDFSIPYFHSGISLLAAPQRKSEIPLLAFLLPFSPELWIAIFTSLNVTAVAVAIYEWLSPFGLNPWGRQRSKNFSMSSALWVMWGLLCGHLVAFKAPKSWPNKFLINVWGGFSVIFIASYTANIAALIAGLFFHNAGNRPEVSLLTQRVGAPISSAAESYMKKYHHHVWEHMKKYPLKNLEEGIRGLKNGSLDLLLGDTAILDYYRATDHGCNLDKVGEPYVSDIYAIGMTKGFPLKDSISALIAKYSSNGYLDILTEKWYGGLPCFKLDNDIVMPRPLGVAAVAGVFLLLGLGIILGVLILIFEHMFFKYTLPILRLKPKGTVWRSRNIMFFSQKLYRFINCVELVSPHHAARELVHTLRQGQIASLFQKSIKRKEDEQRRRRKSKAQFFEMIQEIRRVQQAERMNPKLEVVAEGSESTETAGSSKIPEIKVPSPRSSPRPLKLSPKPRSSPIQKILPIKTSRSRSNSSTLNVRRFSTDSILSERMDTIGRRLSRDLHNSPPDFGRRFEAYVKNNGNTKYDTYSTGKFSSSSEEKLDKKHEIKQEDISKTLPTKKHQNKRTPLNLDTFRSVEDCQQKSKELPVDLIQPTENLASNKKNQDVQTDTSSIAMSKEQVHRSASSQTNYHSARNSRTVKRLNQTHHHRQRSLDGLEVKRPPMPLPSSTRPHSRDNIHVFGTGQLVGVAPSQSYKDKSIDQKQKSVKNNAGDKEDDDDDEEVDCTYATVRKPKIHQQSNKNETHHFTQEHDTLL